MTNIHYKQVVRDGDKKDPNDFRGDEPEEFLARLEDVPPPKPKKANGSGSGDGAESPADVYLTGPAILAAHRPKRWLLENMLIGGRLYQIFGTWKAGKSLIALNMALHLAMERNWCGLRAEPVTVVYVAGEALTDIVGRILATSLQLGTSGDALKHFHLRQKPVGLTSPEYAETLAEELRGFAKLHPDRPVVLYIDTLARNFGSGSESNDEDMKAFADNLLDIVLHPGEVTGIVVHHSGHGEKARGRGHSSWPAVLDGEFQVEKFEPEAGPNVCVMKATQVMRSQASDTALAFEIHVQETGAVDNFGNEDAEPVLEWLPGGYELAAKDKKPTAGQDATLKDFLKLWEAEKQRCIDAEYSVSAAAVTRDQWREAYVARIGKGNTDAVRQQFYRDVKALRGAQWVALVSAKAKSESASYTYVREAKA